MLKGADVFVFGDVVVVRDEDVWDCEGDEGVLVSSESSLANPSVPQRQPARAMTVGAKTPMRDHGLVDEGEGLGGEGLGGEDFSAMVI